MTIPYQKKERVWHDPDQTVASPLSLFEPKYIAITTALAAFVVILTYINGSPPSVIDGLVVVFFGIFFSPVIKFALGLIKI